MVDSRSHFHLAVVDSPEILLAWKEDIVLCVVPKDGALANGRRRPLHRVTRGVQNPQVNKMLLVELRQYFIIPIQLFCFLIRLLVLFIVLLIIILSVVVIFAIILVFFFLVATDVLDVE